MVQPQEETNAPVHNIRLSTVGPGRVTGSDKTHEPTGSDLATKLHYIKAVYFFTAKAASELTMLKIKEAMFYWFSEIFMSCGRFRRDDRGRPFIKCNDCGARFVEETCDQTVEEWLSTADRSVDELLVYHRPVGPDLAFSPLVYITVTRFKCGGISLGLSWAHVLGDPFFFSDILNKWGDVMSGPQVNIPRPSVCTRRYSNSNRYKNEPVSIKRVEPVGDLWVTPNNKKMATFSFHLTAAQVSHIQSKVSLGDSHQIPEFESLCAMIWKCIARVREFSEPKTVTVIKKNPCEPETKSLSNNQIISSVQAKRSLVDTNVEEMAKFLAAEAADETTQISETVEKDNGVSDFIIYGANLTFVDLCGADLYGVKVNGYSAEFVFYNIQGVGDEGVVLVLPVAKGLGEKSEAGRVVVVTVAEEEMVKLKYELMRNDVLFENNFEIETK